MTQLAVRANQRDLYHVAALKDQTEAVLRSWLGQSICVLKHARLV